MIVITTMIEIQKQEQMKEIGKGEGRNLCSRTKDKLILYYNGDVFELSKSNKDNEIVIFDQFKYEDYKISEQQVLESIQFNEVYGITRLSVKTYLILVTKCQVMGMLTYASLSVPILKVKQVKLIEIGTYNTPEPLQHALLDSFKLLHLYYSKYDLTQRAQYSFCHPKYYEQCFISNYDYTLAYSNYPLGLVRKFIFGYANVKEVQRDSVKYRLAVISRGSTKGMGRRWHRRGITQEGYVATNFQTELILEISRNQTTNIYSFVQQRGSIPILWCQNPNLDKTAPFIISPDQQGTTKALKRYIEKQQSMQQKIKLICLINKIGAEARLGEVFEECFTSLHRQNSQLLWYDYHHEYLALKAESFNRLIELIRQDIKQFGFFAINDIYDRQQVTKKQEGVFRINCIDCLDRTNHVQSLISKVYLLSFIDHFNQKPQNVNFPMESVEDQTLQKHFKTLWGQNARAISTQCSGTPAMKMDLYSTGTGNLSGRIRDFGVGTKRFYLGHFFDYYYQNCYDLHFKRLDSHDSQLPIYGSPLKPLALVVSLGAVAGLSYGTYKLISSKVEDKLFNSVASVSGSLLTAILGLTMIKWQSDLFVRRAIIRADYV